MDSARRLWVALFVTLVAFVLVFLVVGAQQPTGAAAPDTVQLGAAVKSSQPQLIDQFEEDSGRTLDAVRVFHLWDDDFPSTKDLELLDSHRLVLSIKPKAGGVEIPWSDIAAAQPGDPLHDDMVRWAEDLQPYADRIYLTFHHEPEASSNLAHGVDTDFIAAWQRFMTVMNDEGLDTLGRVWIMTDYSFHVPSTDRRQAPKWYPGDDWVDAAAVDAYNWHSCRSGTDTRWMTLGEIIEPLRVWGSDHQDKALMVTEIGSVEDPDEAGRKAAWLDDARALFQDGEHDQFELISWFNLEHTSANTDCDWRISTSESAQDAFNRLANDPFFGGGGTPLPPTTTTTTTTTATTTTTIPEALSCRVEVVGSEATLLWVDAGGTYVVRRDGKWLATPGSGASSYVDDQSPPDAVYELLSWEHGVRSTVTCTTATPPTTTTTTTTPTTTTTTAPTTTTTAPTTTTTAPTTTTTTTVPAGPECQLDVAGNDAILTWTDEGGVHVVRRNGTWLATPGRDVSSYTDVDALAGASYELRIWSDGVRTDMPCG